MPVIKALPGLEVIQGFKGTLDFYYWKGIPCVRKWPHTPRAHLTQGTLSSAALFAAILKGYALLGGLVKTIYQEAAKDQDRTGRDLYMSATYGKLHEASMSEITDLIAIANGYLETLIDLTNALQANDADRLLVRGEGPLFNLNLVIATRKSETASYANFHIYSDTVPPGKCWRITNIAVVNNARALGAVQFSIRDTPGNPRFHDITTGADRYAYVSWHGQVDLPAGSKIDAEFRGSQNGDGLMFNYFGYEMNLEV
ncbi:hypothetical protein ES705_19295 [subsurface metagenome]